LGKWTKNYEKKLMLERMRKRGGKRKKGNLEPKKR